LIDNQRIERLAKRLKMIVLRKLSFLGAYCWLEPPGGEKKDV